MKLMTKTSIVFVILQAVLFGRILYLLVAGASINAVLTWYGIFLIALFAQVIPEIYKKRKSSNKS